MLHVVHREIRVHEPLAFVSFVEPTEMYPHTDAQCHHGATKRNGNGERTNQLFKNPRDRRALIQVREQEDKLVVPESGHGILLPNGLREHLPNSNKYRISAGMSQCVVDLLEVIYIDAYQCESAVLTRRTVDESQCRSICRESAGYSRPG